MEFELSPEQREIQSLAREFGRVEIEPHASQWDRDHRFPREFLAKLGEVGLLGVCVPEEHGGGGADFLSYILVLEELSRGDAGVGVTVAVHTSACTLPILAFGTPEQRARFVPPLARGEAIGAFALTESGSGSDAGALKTRAEPVEKGSREPVVAVPLRRVRLDLLACEVACERLDLPLLGRQLKMHRGSVTPSLTLAPPPACSRRRSASG